MKQRDQRLYLSPPEVHDEDIAAVAESMRGGWLAPAGPDLKFFEDSMAEYVGVDHAVALSSGTAALHLGLKYLGVKQGDFVLVPTLTFAATAFAVTYLGAIPYFIDVEPEFGTVDPGLLRPAIDQIRRSGGTVSAAIPVDLYGTPVDYQSVGPVLDEYEVPLLEDAAEALGATSAGRRAGTFGRAAALSFNGNKILTTSGGGMLLTNDERMARAVSKWSTQSREPLPWYEHEDIGYNYRLSNLLAALGQSQLRRIDSTVRHRRTVRDTYREALSGNEAISVEADPTWGVSNAWLTIAHFDTAFPEGTAEMVRRALESVNIESRPIWKPMHQQPVFRDAPHQLTGVADRYFRTGICLPSGPSVTETDVEQICAVISGCLQSQ